MTQLSFAPLALDNSETLKAYFEYVLSAERSGEEFSVDFELVWPLAYAHKADAKKALVRDFFESEDYQINHVRRSPDVARPQGGGTQPEEIRLTPKCLEFFIARKVRAVFEIYRQCRIAVTSSLKPLLMPVLPSQDTRALGRVLVEYIAEKESFNGTPLELLLELSRFAPDAQFRTASWPRSPQLFGYKINLLAPGLLAAGIEISRGKSNGRRMLRIRRQNKQLPQ